MKYCVQSELSFETSTDRDKLNSDCKSKIGSKETWGESVVVNSQDFAGHPYLVLGIRFENRADMDELFELLKGKMKTTLLHRSKVLKGIVSKHECYHDEPNLKRPCVISEKFTK